MWAFDTTLYQIYPLGMLGCPFDAPAIDDDAAQQEQAALHRIRHLIDWAPYLGKLGVGAILLNPVFSSDTHGYNTRDMLTIDCRLGTNQDFKETVDALHACGVRVVLDAVFNHVGRGFWAFRDVREKRWESPANPHSECNRILRGSRPGTTYDDACGDMHHWRHHGRLQPS